MADNTVFTYSRLANRRYDPFTDTYSPETYGTNGIDPEIRTVPSSGLYQINLFESPQQNTPTTTRIFIEGTATELTEVSFNDVPGALEFRVQYDARGNGTIEFNSAQAGVKMEIWYYGLGTTMQLLTMVWEIKGFGASKIFASTDSSAPAQSSADYVIDTATDAAIQINAAINDLNTIGGGEIKLLEGTYNCEQEITLKAGIQITGAGFNTKLVKNEDYNYVIYGDLTTYNNVGVSNLQIDGNKSNFTSTGLYNLYFNKTSSNATYEHAFINKVWSHNSLGGGIGGVNISDCISYDNNSNGITGHNIVNCKAHYNGFMGIDGAAIVNCISSYNTVYGFNSSQRIDNCEAHYNVTAGFYGSQYISNCRSTFNGTSGYESCSGLSQNYATNNTINGFLNCSGMARNNATASNPTMYNNCKASWSGVSYPIGSSGTDTPNGGFNV